MNTLEFDIERARRDTPACKNVIHFNNAGAALMPDAVVESLIEYTRLEAKIGGYETAEQSAHALDNTYRAAAKLLNCQASEIAFVESATRGWDMAFYSISFRAGDVILTGVSEYESNYLAFLQVARRTGVRVEVIPNDDTGQISIDALRNRIDADVKLIAITHIPTNGGLVNPVEEVGLIARDANVLYLLASCQAAGQVDLDVRRLHCDFLSFTGRKYIRGPRGTGILYVRASVCDRIEPIFIDLQSANWISKNEYTLATGAKRFEQWEANCGAKAALGVAIDYALSWGIPEIQARITTLSQRLRSGLRSIAGVELHDLGSTKCGIVSFNLPGLAPVTVQRSLAAKKINLSVSHRRYTRLDMDMRNLNAVCRASVHYYNTEDEVDHVCAEVKKLEHIS